MSPISIALLFYVNFSFNICLFNPAFCGKGNQGDYFQSENMTSTLVYLPAYLRSPDNHQGAFKLSLLTCSLRWGQKP